MCFWQDSRYFCSFFFCLLAGAEARAALLPPAPTADALWPAQGGWPEVTYCYFEKVLWSPWVNSAKLEQKAKWKPLHFPWEAMRKWHCSRWVWPYVCTSSLTSESWLLLTRPCRRQEGLGYFGEQKPETAAPPFRDLQDMWEGTNQSHTTASEELGLEGTEGDLCFPGRRH